MPALDWRPLRQEDAPALFELELECAPVDGDTNPPSLLECERTLEHAAGSLATDTLCAVNAAGQLIACARVTFDLKLKHECRAFLDGTIHPSFRSIGLGSFVLNWMQARARQAFAAVADDRPLVMRIDWTDKGADAIALYEKHGFHFALAEDEMRRDLRDPVPPIPMPNNMLSDSWSKQNAHQFFEVYEDAFRERSGFPGWSEEAWRRAFTENAEFRADLSLLIKELTVPVAYAVCAVESQRSDEGWVAQIGVRPAWRKRGLASALLSELMRRFRGEGLRYALLEVNVDNPQAASVYRRLGFVRTKRHTSFRKTLDRLP